ncbi:MAG: hypothetical protein ABGX10_14685 [Paracoccus sp. (in: a-proteobacteria)]|uniref:hypothetical protein n=1 Tax=Paracoccus sp. TaxID=267 RepID=UPI003242FF27
MCKTILTCDGRLAVTIGAAFGRQIFPAIIQPVSYVLERDMSPEKTFHTPTLVSATHGDGRAAPDGLHSVDLDIPSTVVLNRASGLLMGMAQPGSP